MGMHRNIALATALTAAVGFGVTPALAAGDSGMSDDSSYKTEVLHSETWKPGYTKTDEGDYSMIVPETKSEADGYPMQVLRSDTYKPGYTKTDEGDYIMLAPAQQAQGNSVTILRSDTWKPGYMKDSNGEYMMIVPTD